MINIITLQIESNTDLDASKIDWLSLLNQYGISSINIHESYIIRSTISPSLENEQPE